MNRGVGNEIAAWSYSKRKFNWLTRTCYCYYSSRRVIFVLFLHFKIEIKTIEGDRRFFFFIIISFVFWTANRNNWNGKREKQKKNEMEPVLLWQKETEPNRLCNFSRSFLFFCAVSRYRVSYIFIQGQKNRRPTLRHTHHHHTTTTSQPASLLIFVVLFFLPRDST